MPRIDPLQLINCLQVLLSPSGGILSTQEVQRLVSLMTKFSKKLVSKCVYVLILKNTERTLLDAFMAEGGWTLIQLWLHDAMYNSNWALVKELLELLLITPVDVERLKSNNIPKLVKSLSKREELQGVHELSNQLVQQWLKIVKDETQSTENKFISASSATLEQEELVELPLVKLEQAADDDSALSARSPTFYKVTLKDGKHLISKVDPGETDYEVVDNVEFVEVRNEADMKEDPKEKEKLKKEEEKKRSHDKNKHRSSSSSKSSSSSSSRDKERSSSSRDKDRHSSGSCSSTSSKDKERNKDKNKRDKDKRRSNGSVKSSSSKSSSSSSSSSKDKKETKEKQAEKDKDTLAKLQPQSVQKLPKIPKKSADEKEKEKSKSKENKKDEPKKGTMSIEIRKNNEERPKTVKVYKSKMRSTGLEEEAKPAPPRIAKKPGPIPIIPPAVVPPPVPLKRPSPVRDLSVVPPEKKSKIETPLERPGAIKLIPPKPKPPILQESDMFMDALTASATTKKEPKKRKRRASVSKESSGSSPPPSPSLSTGSVATSPIGLKNITAPKFYQDTLDTDESKSENVESEDGKENTDTNKTDIDEKEDQRATTPTLTSEEIEEEPVSRNGNALKGVLVYMRRKGPKKSIKWKPDDELVDIQYFELDETERVNVTKTFGDMAKMDVRGEREALQMSRKLPNEDVMDVQTIWRVPMEIDLIEALALPGSKSLEKDIQFAREKSVLQALYFSKKMLPDSPMEPDPENYQIKDPITIPIEDIENPEHDFRNKPWPEPKGSPPPQAIVNNVVPVYAPVQTPFQNFGVNPPPAFQNMQPNMQNFAGPGFGPPNVMGGGDWNNGPNMHAPQMIPPNMAPPEIMNQGPMNPNMYMPPPDNFNPMMNDNNHRFPPPFNQHQQGPGMFPQNNFNTNRGGFGGGGGGGGGGFRRGGWARMSGPTPGGWNHMRGGTGGPHRGSSRMCNNIRNKGFCRNRDSCPFFHPN